MYLLQAASALGGERAGRILPEVLRPRDWSRVSRKERRKVGVQRAGVGWGHMGRGVFALVELRPCAQGELMCA